MDWYDLADILQVLKRLAVNNYIDYKVAKQAIEKLVGDWLGGDHLG